MEEEGGRIEEEEGKRREEEGGRREEKWMKGGGMRGPFEE